MILIDGHNLLFKVRSTRRGRGCDLVMLATHIVTARVFKRPAIMVCDGDPPPSLFTDWAAAHSPRERPSLTFQFAGPDTEADELIETMLQASARPDAMAVVSADRRVIAAAKASRAASIPPADVIARLFAASPASIRPAFAENVPLSHGEVARWLLELGIRPDGTPIPRTDATGLHHRMDHPRLRTGARARGRTNPGDAPPKLVPEHGGEELGMDFWLRFFPPLPNIRQPRPALPPDKRKRRPR